jgi:hypothetical protein
MQTFLHAGKTKEIRFELTKWNVHIIALEETAWNGNG